MNSILTDHGFTLTSHQGRKLPSDVANRLRCQADTIHILQRVSGLRHASDLIREAFDLHVEQSGCTLQVVDRALGEIARLGDFLNGRIQVAQRVDADQREQVTAQL